MLAENLLVSVLALTLSTPVPSGSERLGFPVAIGDMTPAALKLWSVAWFRQLAEVVGLEWKAREPGGATVDPVTGTVIVGTRDGYVRAMTSEGVHLWEFEAKGSFDGTPRVAGDTVYVGSNNGFLFALELMTGRLLWKYDTQEEVGTTPVVAEGLVLVSTLADTLFAIDAKTGEWKWHHRREGTSGFTIRGAASAAVADGVVYACYSDGHVASLNAKDGSVRWDRRVAPAGQFMDVDSTPQVSGERLYVGAFSGAVYALDRTSGNIQWEFKSPGTARIKLGPNLLVAVSSDRVIGLQPIDGSVRWSAPLKGAPAGEPQIVGNTALVPNTTGVLWLDATTGKPLRLFNPGTGVTAPVAVRNDRAYVLSNGGALFALDLE